MQMWLRTKVGEEQNEFESTVEIFKKVVSGKRKKKEFHMPREQEYERKIVR